MMPENRKTRFNTLSDRRQSSISLFGISFGYQQTVVFGKQLVLEFCAAITQIANHCLRAEKLRQTFRNRAVSVVARCQNTSANLFFDRRQNVQLEAEKPSLAGFSEIRAIFSEQPHPAMTSCLTHRNWFGIHQINVAFVKRGGRLKEFLDNSRQTVQATNKLLVPVQLGKLRRKVGGNQSKSFLQTFNSELRLQQCNRQDFRVRQTRFSIIAAPPIGNFSMPLQKIIDKAVDFGQFIKYLFHWLSKRANRFSWSNLYFTSLFFDNPFFSTSDWS